MKIDQAGTFARMPDPVHRSSAIFYYRSGPGFTTTITALNYWPLKRGLAVTLYASIREMSGALVRRDRLIPGDGPVVNYRPTIQGRDAFEGSVELEAVCLDDLIVPYLAAMIVFESPASVSMVHSYARAYSRWEVERGRTITQGEEACWTIRDHEPGVQSFAVIHNGPRAQPVNDVLPGGQMTLMVRRHDGDTRTARIWHPLDSYETARIVPAKAIDGLSVWLDGRPGTASLSFQLGEAFTRMLVGNEHLGTGDLQITHSNFHYGRHETDQVPGPAYMVIPPYGGKKMVVVYPERALFPWQTCSSRGLPAGLEDILDARATTLEFTARSGVTAIPSRLVTALRFSNRGRLPAECSLGVLTRAQPEKRFWWGPCAAGRLRSRLVVHALPEIYGQPAHGLEVRVYAASALAEPELVMRLPLTWLDELGHGIWMDELFPSLATFLGGEFGWWTVRSVHGGYTCYSTLERPDGGITFEHGF